MAVIKMSLQLQIQDYFVPAQWKQFSNRDADLGGCGPTVIPNTDFLIVGVTKYTAAHLVNISNMGKWNAQTDSCRQTINVQGNAGPGGNPVAWDVGGGKAKIYMWGPGTHLVQFDYNAANAKINDPYVQWQSGTTSGGGLFLTSNGANNALLWAYSGDGHLYVFDATADISVGPLWSYKMPGGTVHWMWPTIANGKVYIPGGDSKIYAFGPK